MKLGKAEIIESVYDLMQANEELQDASKKQISDIIDALKWVLANNLGIGNEIRLSGLGTFKTVSKPERRARNPQTGESVTVPARKAVTFKPAMALREEINK